MWSASCRMALHCISLLIFPSPSRRSQSRPCLWKAIWAANLPRNPRGDQELPAVFSQNHIWPDRPEGLWAAVQPCVQWEHWAEDLWDPGRLWEQVSFLMCGEKKPTHYYSEVVNCVRVSEREISNLPFSFCSTLAGISWLIASSRTLPGQKLRPSHHLLAMVRVSAVICSLCTDTVLYLLIQFLECDK